MGLIEGNCLDEYVLNMLLGLKPKTQDFQVHQCYNIATLCPKSGKTKYGNSQKIKEMEKIKRVREVEKTIKEIR